jgi:hypothetical protein
MSTQYGYNKIITSGSILLLDFGDPNSYTSGDTRCYDLIPNNNKSGSLINTPTFNSANGGSINFNGTTQYIDMATSTPIEISGNMSILAWINLTNATVARSIVGKTNGAQAAPYDYYIQTSRVPTFFRGNGTTSAFQAASQAIPLNTWTHIAVTQLYTDSAGGRPVSHYINGNLDNTGAVSNNAILTGDLGTSLRIGSRNATDIFMNGNIANVQIYSRELSSSEINQMYNAQKSRFGL